MYKFFVFMILTSLIWFAYINQISYHAAQINYYKLKYAVNRAAHAGTLQLDFDQLAEGHIVIDRERAYDAAMDILTQNLHHQHYSVVLFEVVQLPSSTANLHYVNEQWNIDLVLHQPSVIIVIEAGFEHFILEERIDWKINGTSQVVHSFK